MRGHRPHVIRMGCDGQCHPCLPDALHGTLARWCTPIQVAGNPPVDAPVVRVTEGGECYRIGAPCPTTSLAPTEPVAVRATLFAKRSSARRNGFVHEHLIGEQQCLEFHQSSTRHRSSTKSAPRSASPLRTRTQSKLATTGTHIYAMPRDAFTPKPQHP